MESRLLPESRSVADQDPRLPLIERRLGRIRRILAVTGGKGGVGKSMVASTLALILAEMAQRVGLLDLDFTGPCDHTILGIEGVFPEEHVGLVPPEVHGLRFMSVTHFVGAEPAPLRAPARRAAGAEGGSGSRLPSRCRRRSRPAGYSPG